MVQGHLEGMCRVKRQLLNLPTGSDLSKDSTQTFRTAPQGRASLDLSAPRVMAIRTQMRQKQRGRDQYRSDRAYRPPCAMSKSRLTTGLQIRRVR